MNEAPLRVAMILSDDREVRKEYSRPHPFFGPAPSALLTGLAEMPNCEVHIISCVQRAVSSPPKLADNIFFHPLIVPKSGWLRGAYVGCIAAVRRKLTSIQPHVVHGQGTERYFALAAAFSGFPNVITIHGNMRRIAAVDQAKAFSFAWCTARLERFVLPRTGGVLCNSHHTEKVVSPFAKRTWLVPNAVQNIFLTEPLSREHRGPPVLLNVGTILPNKRQIELLDLATRLWAKGLQFELKFFGQLPPSSDYGRVFLEKLNRVGSAGHAAYLGVLTPAELVREFDVASALVHVPQEEAFGLVVAEALARNLKVFAFKTGGLADITEDVPAAALFPASDWSALQTGIENWLNKGALRITSAETIRNRYAPGKIAQRHFEIYREVLDVARKSSQ